MSEPGSKTAVCSARQAVVVDLPDWRQQRSKSRAADERSKLLCHGSGVRPQAPISRAGSSANAKSVASAVGAAIAVLMSRVLLLHQDGCESNTGLWQVGQGLHDGG